MFQYKLNREQVGRCINIINIKLKDKDIDKELKKKYEDWKKELLFVYSKTKLNEYIVDFEFVETFYKGLIYNTDN